MSPHMETIQQWCALLGEKTATTFTFGITCWFCMDTHITNTHILRVLTLLLVQVVMIQFGIAMS